MAIILPKQGLHEYEEKRSRFIGFCSHVESEEEAKDIIFQIRGREKGANHNVYAYSINTLNIIRFSDDGEPSGTAGMPVLNVFDRAKVTNFVCVVTRYFGGTLLGASGLVRAYTKAAVGCMNDAGPMEQIFYSQYWVSCAYSQLDKVKYNFEKWGVEIQDIQYTDTCTLLVRVQDDTAEPFLDGDFYQINKI